MASRSASRTVVSPSRCLPEFRIGALAPALKARGASGSGRRLRAGYGAAGLTMASAAAAAGVARRVPPLFFIAPRRGIFAVSQQHGDDGVHLHTLGALGDLDLAEVPSSTASTSMVALSVSISAITSPDEPVAFFLQPLGQLALFHGRRQRRHQNINRHGALPPLKAYNVGVELGHIRLRIVLREVGGLGDDLARPSLSTALSRLRWPVLLLEQPRLTCSIGSCSSRIFCTSSLVRYFAGSDME
jgi:hypothetical protein